MSNLLETVSSPCLLVSVRNATEARAALAGGADILDVKEPSRGSLGMGDLKSISGVIRVAESAGRKPRVSVSAALGETVDWLETDRLPSLPAGLDYVKLGLAGMGRVSDWIAEWRQARKRLEANAKGPLKWIAVAYADWRSVSAPKPQAVVEAAIRTGCAGVLFDTSTKQDRTLRDWITGVELARLSEPLRDSDQLLAVAGNLNPDVLSDFIVAEPDIVAIRTAGCRGGKRTGAICQKAVGKFKRELEAVFVKASS